MRDSTHYVRQCIAEHHRLYCWDIAGLLKWGENPVRFLQAFNAREDARVLVLADEGTKELSFSRPNPSRPVAVYPTWRYGLNPVHLLDEWVAVNQNDNAEHRVVIRNIPNTNTKVGRRFMAYLGELQDEFPDTIIHTSGLHSFVPPLIHGVAASDWNPRISARKNAVFLPNGVHVKDYKTGLRGYRGWVGKVGFTPSQLSKYSDRLLFNFRSFRWAADHWQGDMRRNSRAPEGWENLFRAVKDIPTKKELGRLRPGDMIVCNHCTKWKQCSLYREGQVCTVPDSPGKKFADHYRSNDPDTILDGILEIVEEQHERYIKGKKAEGGELDPEVSKLANQLVKTGFDIAKMKAPKGAAVNINVAGHAQISEAPQTRDQHQLVATAVAELEAAGWERGDLSEEMLKNYMKTGRIPTPGLNPAPTPNDVIEAEIVASGSEDE